MPVDDGGVDDTCRSRGVLGVDDGGRQVQHERDDGDAGRASAVDQRATVLGPGVRGIDDGHLAAAHASGQGLVQDAEGDRRGALVGLVPRDCGTQGIR